MGVVPFISQIAAAPSLFCQRMSVLPSLLKSAAAITCHDGPGFASVTVLVALVPFISQICGRPLFWRMMSALLSLLKSPEAWTVQPFGVVIVPEAAKVSPLSNSTFTSGVPANGWFCSSRSDLLSPSKSLRTDPLIEMVVVAAVLRLLEPLPSLTTQVRVRVRLRLPLLGLLPDEKVTESSTDW